MNGIYRTQEICDKSGFTYRQIDYWVSKELFRSSVQEPNGSGVKRLWNDSDLDRVMRVKELRDTGFSHDHIMRIMPPLLPLDPRPTFDVPYIREHKTDMVTFRMLAPQRRTMDDTATRLGISKSALIRKGIAMMCDPDTGIEFAVSVEQIEQEIARLEAHSTAN